MRKYDDRTGSMTGAPTKRERETMEKVYEKDRLKMGEKMKGISFANDTKKKNSTPIRKTAAQIFKGIDKGFNLIRRKKI